MTPPPAENATRTVLELDLASYSDIARALEENLDVHAVRAFEDQVQSFVDHGLAAVGLARTDVVLGSAGDNAILVFDDPAVMHRFADAVQRFVAAHNARKSVASARRWFRMGAATGPVLLLQAERRIVGTTVARAVRLEAAAGTGQLVVDAATYDLLPAALKGYYGREEEVRGKRDERFPARRYTFVPADAPRRSARPVAVWAAVAAAVLVCAVVAGQVMKNRGGGGADRQTPDGPRPDPPARPLPTGDPDRDAARWALGIGATVKITVRGEERAVTTATLPDEPFRLTHVDFRRARRVADADLAHLAGSGVIDLNLEGQGVTDTGLAALADLPLLCLDLNGVAGVTDAGAGRLAGIRTLMQLYLNDTKVSDDGLARLAELPELEELTVRRTRVTPAGVAKFRAALGTRPGFRMIEAD